MKSPKLRGAGHARRRIPDNLSGFNLPRRSRLTHVAVKSARHAFVRSTGGGSNTARGRRVRSRETITGRSSGKVAHSGMAPAGHLLRQAVRPSRLLHGARFTNQASMYLYFAKCDSFVKIGISGNPVDRLSELQVGNPRAVSFVGVLKRRSQGEAEALERALHSILRRYQIRGEWFEYGPIATVIKALNSGLSTDQICLQFRLRLQEQRSRRKAKSRGQIG